MKTVAKTEDKSDCPKTNEKYSSYSYNLKSCSESEFECCPDGLTPANVCLIDKKKFILILI